MKIQFLAGLALGAVVGMLVVDNCPKAQKVMDEGKRDARFAISFGSDEGAGNLSAAADFLGKKRKKP